MAFPSDFAKSKIERLPNVPGPVALLVLTYALIHLHFSTHSGSGISPFTINHPTAMLLVHKSLNLVDLQNVCSITCG